MTEVVAALIWDGNKFLACQRPAHKARGLLWEFVGGKVEPGETGREAQGSLSLKSVLGAVGTQRMLLLVPPEQVGGMMERKV